MAVRIEHQPIRLLWVWLGAADQMDECLIDWLLAQGITGYLFFRSYPAPAGTA